MDGYRRLLPLLVLAGLLCTGAGCCFDRFGHSADPVPRALPPAATLEDVIETVNRNNSQIESFWTPEARLSVPGAPTLRADIAYQRPLRFRLRAKMMGPELDLGSNDQQFWFWVKRSQTPAVFHCRHDQFPTSRAKQMIPIDPYWLIEALGTAQFDRGLAHHGPFPVPGSQDRLEIRTIRDMPDGRTVKSTIVDAARGYVIEQHIYDAQDRLLASSVAGGHRRDPATGLIMPTSVEVSCPAANFTMTVDLGNVRINRLPDNPSGLWSMPNERGMQFVDLCNPPPASPTGPPAVSRHPRPTRPGLPPSRF